MKNFEELENFIKENPKNWSMIGLPSPAAHRSSPDSPAEWQ